VGMKKVPILWWIFILALSLPSAAQNRFIVRPTATGSIANIAARHGLNLLGPLDGRGRGIVVVTASTPFPPGQFVKHARGDVDCANIEFDSRMAVSESPASLSQSSVAILDKMPTPSAISYYGVPVLGFYLSQPATSIIRLQQAQTTFAATGSGTVA